MTRGTRTEVTINIPSSGILTEVGRITNFAAIKQEKAEGDFERISTKETDADMLQTFWKSACDTITDNFKSFVKQGTLSATSTEYQVVLLSQTRYDTSLTNSLVENLKSFLTLYIAGRWFAFTNREEAKAYLGDAGIEMIEAINKWYHKKKPTRVTPTT